MAHRGFGFHGPFMGRFAAPIKTRYLSGVNDTQDAPTVSPCQAAFAHVIRYTLGKARFERITIDPEVIWHREEPFRNCWRIIPTLKRRLLAFRHAPLLSRDVDHRTRADSLRRFTELFEDRPETNRWCCYGAGQ